MDILLFNKASEMIGLDQSNFADGPAGQENSMGKMVWIVITVFCIVFAMWHAYNANKCEKNGSNLIMALVLSFLFPKTATLFYAMRYKAMPWGADKNARLIKRYRGKRDDWDLNKCSKWEETISSSLPTTSEKELGGMFGGWA